MIEKGAFFEGAYLFANAAGLRSPVASDPPDWICRPSMPTVLVNSFPIDPPKSPIYAFTVGDELYIAYHFVYDRTNYSIVVLVARPYPFLYWTFLRDIAARCEETKKEITADCRFTLICPLLKSWEFLDDSHIIVNGIRGAWEVDLNDKTMVYGTFNPFASITSKFNAVALWKTVLHGSGRVRICGRDPTHVAIACFGIASLVRPFPFERRILLAATAHDPRAMSGDFQDYAIVAYVVKNAVRADDRFEHTLMAGSGSKEEALRNAIHLTEVINDFYTRIDIVSRVMLVDDLYGLLIESDGEKKDVGVARMAGPGNRNDEFSDREVEDLLRTEMWRNSKLEDRKTRDAFLAVMPEEVLKGRSHVSLRRCQEVVEKMMSMHRTDRHLYIVLRRHRKFIIRELEKT